MPTYQPCPYCDGDLTSSDVRCDAHLSGCGNSFPAWFHAHEEKPSARQTVDGIIRHGVRSIT